MNIVLVLLLLIPFSDVVAADIHGVFTRANSSSPVLFKSDQGRTSQVRTETSALLASIESLATHAAAVSLPEESFTSDGTLILSRAPMLDRGSSEVTGVLQTGSAAGEYVLNGLRTRFTPGKVLNGYEFDEISRQHFQGKKVITRGRQEGDFYTIDSIVEAGLFSAEPTTGIVGSADAPVFHREFLSARTDYILHTLPEFARSSSVSSFRGTVYDSGREVKPGDPVMMLTLSGSQGDSASAVNGHIAVGLGRVREDMSIDGEFYNLYFPPDNPKGIVSGSQRWVDYFGNVITGQNNYRPGYTWMIYGVDPARLERVRESLEPYHVYFRTADKKMSVDMNCATLTVESLAREGIYGEHRNGKNGSRRFPTLPDTFSTPKPLGIPAQLAYITHTPKAEFMPRNAWESIFENLQLLSDHEALGIHRIDFVFYGQTPSHRPRGGIAADGLGDEFRSFLGGEGGRRRVK